MLPYTRPTLTLRPRCVIVRMTCFGSWYHPSILSKTEERERGRGGGGREIHILYIYREREWERERGERERERENWALHSCDLSSSLCLRKILEVIIIQIKLKANTCQTWLIWITWAFVLLLCVGGRVGETHCPGFSAERCGHGHCHWSWPSHKWQVLCWVECVYFF